MLRVLTGEQVPGSGWMCTQALHDNLHIKPSSYKFYYKFNPTPAQVRKGGPWGVVWFLKPIWNGQCSFDI